MDWDQWFFPPYAVSNNSIQREYFFFLYPGERCTVLKDVQHYTNNKLRLNQSLNFLTLLPLIFKGFW